MMLVGPWRRSELRLPLSATKRSRTSARPVWSWTNGVLSLREKGRSLMLRVKSRTGISNDTGTLFGKENLILIFQPSRSARDSSRRAGSLFDPTPRQEKERDKKERQAAENEIRELGRQSQQAQQVALAQLQAAHTVPALHKFTSTTPSTMTPGFLPNVQGEWRPHEGIPDKEMSLTQTLDAGALSEQLPNAGGGCSLLFAVGGLQRANSPLWTAEVFETDKGGWRLLPEMKSARG